MFYSHEILTSRKYGVATVWLVATLGAKSSTKKVTRKAILDVDVRKACDTIIQPEAPMALRLQSNLLYGVSRVYDQQCHYVLLDAQTAQNNIRTMLMSVKNNDLEPGTGKARPDQLILLDDPAFLPETALPALDFDLSTLEWGLPIGSQRSSESMMSIHGYSHSNSTPSAGHGLQLPSSSTHAGPNQLPFDDPFVGTSTQKPFGSAGQGLFDDEGEYFQDDMIFEFDANGEMRDIDVSEREARKAGRVQGARLGSDSAGSGRVRKEHEEANIPEFDAMGDFDMANFYEDGMQALPNAEAFPMMSGALGGNDNPQDMLTLEDHVYEESFAMASSNKAEAPLKSRKARTRKIMGYDRVVELRNGDLIQWQADYKTNMAAATLLTLQRKAQAQAKKNAFWYVCGAGLNGVGNGVGSVEAQSPLDMFTGETLLSKITGKSISSAVSKSKTTKRALDVNTEEQVTPKRVRQAEPGSEFGRGDFEDEQGIMLMEDGSVGMEVGRDAPSALADHPSSAMMPWNVSASLNSHQKGASSSHQRGHGSTGRRPLSASPLVGRGSALPGALEHFSLQGDETMHGRNDDLGSELEPGFDQAEFEIFGPAAQVDTQTAGDSQWVRDALAREAGNFFEYVLNSISEKAVDELEGDGERAGLAEKEKFVTFEELFNPNQNSRIVAAQAFYHLLSLATKGRAWVMQDMETLGPIQIGVIS